MIHLLCDFDERLFTTHPLQDLLEEDKRLHIVAEETKKRREARLYRYK